MPSRVMPQDRPARTVRGRNATIFASTPDPHTYYVIVDNGKGLPEPAYYGGLDPLPQSTPVRVTSTPELSRWHIEKVDTPNWFTYFLDSSTISHDFSRNGYYEDNDIVFDGNEWVFVGGAQLNVFAPWFWNYSGDDWPTIADGTLVTAICEVLETAPSLTMYYRFRHYFVPTVLARVGFEPTRQVDANEDNTDVGWVELGRSETFSGVGSHQVTFSLQGDIVSPNAVSWNDDAFDANLGGFQADRIRQLDNYMLELVIVDSDPDEIDGHELVLQIGNRNYFGVDRPMFADNLDEWEGMDGDTWMSGPFVLGDKLCHITAIGNNIVLYGKLLTELEPVTLITYVGLPSLNSWEPLAWISEEERLFYPSDVTPFVVDGKAYFTMPQLYYTRVTDLWYNEVVMFTWSGVGTKLTRHSTLDLGEQETGNRISPPYDYTDYNFLKHYSVLLDSQHIAFMYEWYASRVESTGLLFPTLIGHLVLDQAKYVEWSVEDGWGAPVVVANIDPVYVGDYYDPFAYVEESLVPEAVIPAYDDGAWVIYGRRLNRVAEFTWFDAYPVQTTLYAVRVKDGVIGTPVQLAQGDIPVSLALSATGDLWQWGGYLSGIATRRAGTVYLPVVSAWKIDTFIPPPNFNLISFTDVAVPSVGIAYNIFATAVSRNTPSSEPHVSDENHNYIAYTKDLADGEDGPELLLERDYGSPETMLSVLNGPYNVGFNYLTKGILYNGKLYAFFQMHNGQSISGWMLALMEYTL